MWRMLLVVIRCSSFSVLRRIVYMNGKWFVVFVASFSSLGYVLYICGHSVTIQRDKWRLSGTSNVCMYERKSDTILLRWQQGRQCTHNVTVWRVRNFHLLHARISRTTLFACLSERNKKWILNLLIWKSDNEFRLYCSGKKYRLLKSTLNFFCHRNATMSSVCIVQLKNVAL